MKEYGAINRSEIQAFIDLLYNEREIKEKVAAENVLTNEFTAGANKFAVLEVEQKAKKR